jgi:2-dehydropantoate 2-reductase
MTAQTIAIVGLGGVGSVVAAALGLAGRHRVIACARRAASTITLHHPNGIEVAPIDCVTDPADVEPVEWILLCTKAQDTAAAGNWLRKLSGSATRIAVLQNGLGHAERVAPFAPGAQALPVIVHFNAERFGSNAVRLRHVPDFDMVVSDSADDQAFSGLFANSLLQAYPAHDFPTRAWRKLLINVVGNTLTAITRQRGHVLRRDDVQALAVAMLEEAVTVGRADGADLATDEAAKTWALIMTYPPDAGSSMYHDMLAGRALEAEAITGAVVRGGERHGIPTPLNRMMLTLLKAISDAATPNVGGA